MKESWICRDYREGDERQILALFKEVFGQELSLAFWRWRFIENPFGRGIIKLLFDGQELIGHYALMPVAVQVKSGVVKAAFSMTTMTHPDYSGKGIFAYLAEETYKLCQERGLNFVYGFPNRNSYPGFAKRLRWHLAKMTVLKERQPSATKRRPIRTNLSVKKVERFEDTMDLLWDRVKEGYAVAIPRTKQYLNWRFVSSPDVQYAKYIVSDSYQTILGYVVLKTYTGDNIRRGHIVDIMSVTDEEIVRVLLDSARDYYFRDGTVDISCWLPQNSFYSNILEKEGFVREETDTYFGVRVFDEANLLAKGVEQLSSWFITMGDSDVF